MVQFLDSNILPQKGCVINSPVNKGGESHTAISKGMMAAMCKDIRMNCLHFILKSILVLLFHSNLMLNRQVYLLSVQTGIAYLSDNAEVSWPYSYYLPNSIFRITLPIFLSTPAFVIGTPVVRLICCFA